MKSLIPAILVVGALTLGAAPAYQNKTLNPVKFGRELRHAPVQLIENGTPRFAIVRDMRAEAKEISDRKSIGIAVAALQDALERMGYGQAVVLDASSPDIAKYPCTIAVGRSSYTDKLKITPAKFDKEGFLVQSHAKGVVIAGDDGSLLPGAYDKSDWSRYRINGTANGMYDFLERVFGMRYYYPGIGVVAPKTTNLKLEPVAYTDAPEFKNRFNWGFSLKFRKGLPWKNVKNNNGDFDKAWRLAMSTRFNDVCHSPDPQIVGKAFPELHKTIFYTDKSGFRYYTPASHIGNLFDITNPEFASLLVAWAKKFDETQGKWALPWERGGNKGLWYPPNREYFLFGQTDTYADMESEKNKHLFPASRRDNRSGSLSDLYCDFYIRLADELKKELPGKKLGVLAYHRYTLPPVTIKEFPDNIRVQLCMGRIVNAPSRVTQKHWLENFSAWTGLLRHPVSAWTYGAQGSAFTKAIQGRYMGSYIRLLSPHLWRDGFMYDADGLDWTYYYSYYPVYRAMWSPDFDGNAALDEHWEKLYGKAAGTKLKAFYDLLVERWEKVYIPAFDRASEATGSANQNVIPELFYQAYNTATIARLEKLLKEAVAATIPGSIERQRVDFFAEPFAKDFAAARAYASLDIPLYEVRRLSPDEPITVDGKSSDPVWKRAAVMKFRDAKGSGLEAFSRPEARMLWNDKGIYVLFTAQGKPATNKGDVFFKSDNIELFLSPGNGKEQYFQFAANPTNDFFDASCRLKPIEAGLDRNWSCPNLKHAATFDGKSWTLELFVPFEGLRVAPPKPYKTWFANFINNKVAPAEYSAFSLTMGNNHNLDLFGKIKFMGKGD